MPGVVTAVPEISTFEITSDLDFIIIGCKKFNKLGDGIFDYLQNDEIIKLVWESTQDQTRGSNVNRQCAISVDIIMKSALERKTYDNITLIFIAFTNKLDYSSQFIILKFICDSIN